MNVFVLDKDPVKAARAGKLLLGSQINIMSDTEQIIEDNERLINIGGHFFEGETKHNRKIHRLLQMSDLIPFEEQGLISRINAYDGIGKRYVSAFVCNK